MDGVPYISDFGNNMYKLGVDFKGTTRFMILNKEQVKQLEQEIRNLKL